MWNLKSFQAWLDYPWFKLIELNGMTRSQQTKCRANTVFAWGKVGQVDNAEFYFTVISAAVLPGNSFWLSVVYVNKLIYLFWGMSDILGNFLTNHD